MILFTKSDLELVNKDKNFNYVRCPVCASQNVRKITHGKVYNRYQCHNQAMECCGEYFAVMNFFLDSRFTPRCASCDSIYQKRINEAGSLVISLRCGNHDCNQFDIPKFYNLKKSSYFHLPISKKEKKQHYIIWWLNHNPFQEDLDVIQRFLGTEGFCIATHTNNKLSFDYRRIIIEKVDYHLKATQKYYGFSINVHIDLSEHGRAIFNKDTMILLSKLYLYIKSHGNGKPFIIPRESSALTRYIKSVRIP
ncbi:MAG: hypothetical protein BAJALOKI1v1_1340014 [Promethearchaeota archaeon]|nr:MAG: hypothetical protein BAJALOKI1v1_1340014 [Candidatus Lokiarchaeota archaeon]